MFCFGHILIHGTKGVPQNSPRMASET